jgi:septal ring factor EnvC (AmiA/AmiB activator)
MPLYVSDRCYRSEIPVKQQLIESYEREITKLWDARQELEQQLHQLDEQIIAAEVNIRYLQPERF